MVGERTSHLEKPTLLCYSQHLLCFRAHGWTGRVFAPLDCQEIVIALSVPTSRDGRGRVEKTGSVIFLCNFRGTE